MLEWRDTSRVRSACLAWGGVTRFVLAVVLALWGAPALGQNVLLIWDVNNAETQSLKSTLEANGMTVTLSATDETSYDGTNPSPAGFNAVVHLNGTTYSIEMPVAGQNALVAYVQAGGGFIHGEWNAYEISVGRMLAMQELTLFDRVTGANGPTTYTDVPAQAGHPILANVPSSFSFNGSRNVGPAHTFAVNPVTVLMTDDLGSDAVAVRLYGGGRVVGFNHSGNWNGEATLGDPNIQQLYVDAIRWAAGTAMTSITCADWTAHLGTWGPGTPPCGDLTSTTTSTKYESESFGTVFGDFTYQAQLIATRPNQPTASNTLFVRGTPAPLQTSAQRWNTGYAFNYTTNGKYSIFRYNGASMTTVQSWVAPVGTSINGSGSPNTLKVIANGGTLTFFVNGVSVKQITGQTLLSGQVGVGMVRSIPTTGPGPNDMLEVVSASVGPVEPGFGPRGPGAGEVKGPSLEQERANALANRMNPNPDPFFDGPKGAK